MAESKPIESPGAGGARSDAEQRGGSIDERDPGAQIAPDYIDPDLIKLKRARPKVGVITAAGLVFLCAFFLIKLQPDRRFAGAGATPDRVAIADVLAGNVASDRFIVVDGEPVMSHAIRATQAKGNLGLRVTPMRGTGERVWLVLAGDGWDTASPGGYAGRLRKLDELPFWSAVSEYAETHPRPVFATAAAVRGAFGTGQLTAVGGEPVTLADADVIAFDLIDPNASIVIGSIEELLPDALRWGQALNSAGITTPMPPTADAALGQVRFEVPMSAQLVTQKLEAGSLWAARVEPVTRHFQTTWGALRTSKADGFAVTADAGSPDRPRIIPDAELDLVGLYVARAIPPGAYGLITGERPADYWYVLPITVGLALIGLVFAWALVRAVRRDLMTPASPTT